MGFLAKSCLPVLTVTIIFFVVYGQASTLTKRDVEDTLDDIGDSMSDAKDAVIPQGGACVTDDQCSFVEYCDQDVTNILQGGFHCKLTTWFIGLLIGVAVLIVLSLGASCVCCPCCCLYSMCRKS